MHTFRAVEDAFARVQDVVEACELCRFGEGGFSLVPDFVGTHALWTPAASALRLSNENKRVGRFASVAAFIKYKFINDLCLNKFAHFCFRCIRLVRYSGRVENFTTISSKPKGASASLFASVMTVCKQPVATLGSWIVVVDLTPLASAAAPRSCQNSEAQAFCRDTRLARFPSRGRRSRPLRILVFWAFPTLSCGSGYIARPPVRTCGTPARLLQPSLAPRVLSPRGHYP